MVPWRYLNWKGKLNTILGTINLVCAFILVMDKDWMFLLNFTIAFFCFMANYLTLNQVSKEDDKEK